VVVVLLTADGGLRVVCAAGQEFVYTFTSSEGVVIRVNFVVSVVVLMEGGF
jgi:hypothetical protein